MTTRRTMQILSVIASVALVVTPVLTSNNETGGTEAFGVCSLDGAWLGSIDYGFYVLGWTAVYDSDTHWTGRSRSSSSGSIPRSSATPPTRGRFPPPPAPGCGPAGGPSSTR